MMPIWIFDLDNTLHHADPLVFPTINRAMTDYIIEMLQVTESEANHLRERYWARYGATLQGLVRHHRIDPEHFLWHTHPLARMTHTLYPKAGLHRTLARLPGRKLLFTNGPRHYAAALLSGLGIDAQFDGILTPQDCHYLPKPYVHGYRTLLARYRLQAEQCIMVEDSLANLRPAKRLGMKTVWLRRGYRQSPWADVCLPDLHHLPNRLDELILSN